MGMGRVLQDPAGIVRLLNIICAPGEPQKGVEQESELI